MTILTSMFTQVVILLITPAFAIAEQSPNTTQAKGGLAGMLLPLVIIFGIFYFLLIRPQQKQQKKHKQMLEAMKKGDKAITRGGIHGKIHGIAESVVTLEIADNIRIKINKEAIAFVEPSKE